MTVALAPVAEPKILPRVTRIFLLRDNRFALLGKIYPAWHHHHDQRLAWLPGGRCEAGETAAACALREATEELGITPLQLQPVFRCVNRFGSPMRFYACPAWTGTPAVRELDTFLPTVYWPTRREFVPLCAHLGLQVEAQLVQAVEQLVDRGLLR